MQNQNAPGNSQVRLVGMTGAYRNNSYFFKGDELLIGRAMDCQLLMNENTISGQHAKIVKSGEKYEIQDLQSTNGTFVNGVKIDRKLLRTGDKIKFDQYEFQFINPADVARTVMATPEALKNLAQTMEREPRPAVPASPPQPHPQKAPAAPVFKIEEPRESRKSLLGGLVLGVFAGLLVAFGLPFLSALYRMNQVGALSAESAFNFLKNWAVGVPGMYTHEGWKALDLKSLPSLIVLIGLALGPFLGGLIAQIRGRRLRPSTALAFSVCFVAVALALQLVVIKLAFGSWPSFFPPIAASLGAWGNFALCLVYFLVVVLVLSYLGTLLARPKKLE
jgi:pSer/pThr/pTyr-binding forkhead associated (FHA) protein